MELDELYETAARQANKDGIKADNEKYLLNWIRLNCKYDSDNEFFLVLGIGCALANIQAKEEGFDNEVHRVFEVVINKPSMREKHKKWLRYH